MIKFIKKNKYQIINIFIIIILFLLPYYLFKGKFYIGGDDTRLLYLYPKEYLLNYGLFSWLNYSSSGINAPWQFLVPFLAVWEVLNQIIQNKIFIGYLAFSLPMILAFIYMQKLIKEIIGREKYETESMIGALIFILSPILTVNQLWVFLSTVWLMGLTPIMFYYYLSYLRTGKFSNAFKAIIYSTFLSLAFLSIPWILGTLLPIILGILLLLPILGLVKFKVKIKRTAIYAICLLFTQQFWFLPFISSYNASESNDLGTKILSEEISNTFAPTVIPTATGNILYPILNLFHRQIAFDFDWHLAVVFTNFYDKFFYLGIIFIIIIAFAIFFYTKQRDIELRKKFLLFFTIFIISLAFFTVNIGPFKDLFILFGNIPGFVMFRNFYDKFAFGYIFIYSILISLSLTIFRDKISESKYKVLVSFLILVIFIQFLPAEKIINAPLWQTKSTSKNILIPSEYLSFMEEIKKRISPSSNILIYPMSTAVYSIIKEEGSNNVYLGASPTKIFTNVNDFSGNMSFNYGFANVALDDLFISRDYEGIADYLKRYNINYLLRIKNMPEEASKAAWAYRQDLIGVFDEKFIQELTSSKIIESTKGNYVLYDLKKKNIAINGEEIYFTKINPVAYKIYLKNVDSKEIIFNDSFHGGWSLYLEKNPNKSWCRDVIQQLESSNECKSIFSGNQIFYLNSLFNKNYNGSHKIKDKFANSWTLNKDEIKANYSNEFYELNDDGSVNIGLTLYFKPQNYFLIGILFSVISFGVIIFYLIYEKKKKN